MACRSLDTVLLISLAPLDSPISSQLPALGRLSSASRCLNERLREALKTEAAKAARIFEMCCPAISGSSLRLSDWQEISKQCLATEHVDVTAWMHSSLRLRHAGMEQLNRQYVNFLLSECLPKTTIQMTHLLFTDTWSTVQPNTAPDIVMDLNIVALVLTSERSFAIFVATLGKIITDDDVSFVEGTARVVIEATLAEALDAAKAVFKLSPVKGLQLHLKEELSDDDEIISTHDDISPFSMHDFISTRDLTHELITAM